jgi:CrcB protein
VVAFFILKDKMTKNNLPLDPDAAQPGIAARLPHKSLGLQAIIFIGGGLGTLGRYCLSVLVPVQIGSWPYATFITNMIGALSLGILLQTLLHLGADKGKLRLIRLGVGTGFIGGFTTFSTLAVETDLLIKHNRATTAVAYAVTSVIGGIVMSMVGIRLGSQFHKVRSEHAS